MKPVRAFCAALPFALVAACNTPAPQAPSQTSYQNLPAGVAPAGFALPSGAGCQGDVARFQAIIDNDLASGHTTKSVHDAVSADLGKAQAACSAGRDKEASAMVTATRKRFGYPAS